MNTNSGPWLLVFGLAEDMVGLFPWKDGRRWDFGNPGVGSHINKPSYYTTISPEWALGMLPSQSQGRA